MSLPSRSQRSQLSTELKRFAFEQSPMFAENRIQSMELAQTYEFIDETPEESTLPGTLLFDHTKITLGFTATRFANGCDGKPPVYAYSGYVTGEMLVHPRQLQLSEDAWHELQHKYIEPFDEDEGYSPGEVLEGVEELDEQEVQDEIINELIDGGAECSLYKKTLFSFATVEPAIESSFEKGVSIDNAVYDVFSTHQDPEEFGAWERHETVDDVLWVPPKLVPDNVGDSELAIGDQIEVRTQFFEIIRGLGLDNEAANNDLLPHEDKLRELRFIVECLRQRRITTL